MNFVCITRKLEFDAAHRVLNHGGKCKHLHGHRYVAEIAVHAPDLDRLGMVLDFSFLKEKVGGWIDTAWDHNIILHPEDPLLDIPPESSIWGGQKPYIMPDFAANPTVENMVQVLAQEIRILLPQGIKLATVRLYETPNCWADVGLLI